MEATKIAGAIALAGTLIGCGMYFGLTQERRELAHYINIELVDNFLLRGRLGWHHVGDDGGHFLRRAAPAEAT